MLFAVRFVDKPDMFAVRQAQLQAHIDWLDAQRGTVLVGGSLRHDPGENPVGGLWLVDAPDKATIERLMRTDPFWIHGLRASYEILHWSKAHPDRQAII